MKRRYNSRSVRFAYLLLLLVLTVDNFALDPKAAFDKYIYRQWSVKDGLPHDSVTCFAQDAQGFIRIGTDNGLVRFDGDGRDFSPADSYHQLLESDGLISAVFSGDGQPAGWQTTDGRMWFPTVNGIAVINPGEIKFKDPVLPVRLEKLVVDDQTFFSQTVNQCFYMNFNQFLNKYRIEEAKERLKDPKESQYVVFKIALDVGFNSKSTFNTAFKKFTGMNPSQYREKYLGEKSTGS